MFFASFEDGEMLIAVGEQRDYMHVCEVNHDVGVLPMEVSRYLPLAHFNHAGVRVDWVFPEKRFPACSKCRPESRHSSQTGYPEMVRRTFSPIFEGIWD